MLWHVDTVNPETSARNASNVLEAVTAVHPTWFAQGEAVEMGKAGAPPSAKLYLKAAQRLFDLEKLGSSEGPVCRVIR